MEKNLKGINWKGGNRIVVSILSPFIKLKQFSAVNMFNILAAHNTQNALSFNYADNEISIPFLNGATF